MCHGELDATLVSHDISRVVAFTSMDEIDLL